MDKRFGIRAFWLICGLIALGLGLIGAVLPLIPTTPFLLVAAYAFARSSPRLASWLENHPQFGPLIANWREHGAISVRAKLAAMAAIIAAPIISIALGVSTNVLFIQLAVLSIVTFFVLSRPSGPAR